MEKECGHCNFHELKDQHTILCYYWVEEEFKRPYSCEKWVPWNRHMTKDQKQKQAQELRRLDKEKKRADEQDEKAQEQQERIETTTQKIHEKQTEKIREFFTKSTWINIGVAIIFFLLGILFDHFVL